VNAVVVSVSAEARAPKRRPNAKSAANPSGRFGGIRAAAYSFVASYGAMIFSDLIGKLERHVRFTPESGHWLTVHAGSVGGAGSCVAY
jgi:hypothetical protein